MPLLGGEQPVETSALRRAEEYLASVGEYPDTFHGRGIVMCGGGERYFTNAWISISLLRHVGCRLPIQLWYLGKDELDPYMEELVAPLEVECVDATAVRERHPARILRGWEVKPFAILHSPFRDVMLLDADNFAAKDPEYLFDSWEYREVGALFWPDAGRLSRDHASWQIFGVPFADEPEVESGQLVIDKERCWRALCLTKHYNDYSDFYYRYVHGDKETFHFAFHKAAQPYAMTTHPMRFDGGTFFQHDFEGDVVFQHRNHAKWSLTGENAPEPGFRFEVECKQFLEALRNVWDGTIGGPRGGAAPAATVLKACTELKRTVYRYARDGYGYWPMTFMDNGCIGIGATAAEQTWRVFRANNRLVLEIRSEIGPTAELMPDDRGWKSVSGVALTPIPGKAGAFPRAPLSLNEFVDKALAFAEPLSQNTAAGNLGFGWIYYGFARNLAPDFVIVIGSARGFAPLCAARALHDNGSGEVIFIDPGYSGSGDPAWDGRGHWQHPSEVDKWFRVFGLAGTIRHLKLRSDDALSEVQALVTGKRVGLVVIDGAHTHEQSLRDFDQYSPLISDGVVLFHDATNPNCGVAQTLRVLRTRGLDVVTLDRDAGLSMVQITRPARVDDKWSYLTASSNRGERIMEYLRPLLRDGDLVFEAYCGFSPLNAHYNGTQVFGFDVDPAVIQRLREEYPGRTWIQIDEKHLAFADIPDRADVLVGLGLSRGYCGWDPQLVERNMRFLVGHYRPRVCLFEAAAEYYNAEILQDLRQVLHRAGYACRDAKIDSTMTSFHVRQILIGTRK
jgi:hypothetical protein